MCDASSEGTFLLPLLFSTVFRSLGVDMTIWLILLLMLLFCGRCVQSNELRNFTVQEFELGCGLQRLGAFLSSSPPSNFLHDWHPNFVCYTSFARSFSSLCELRLDRHVEPHK